MPTALWTRSPAKAQVVCQSWFGRSHACFRHTRVPGRPPDIRPDGAPPTCRRLAAEGRGAALVLADAMGGADVRVIERGGGLRFSLPNHRQWCPVGRSSSMYQPRRTEYQTTPNTEQIDSIVQNNPIQVLQIGALSSRARTVAPCRGRRRRRADDRSRARPPALYVVGEDLHVRNSRRDPGRSVTLLLSATPAPLLPNGV